MALSRHGSSPTLHVPKLAQQIGRIVPERLGDLAKLDHIKSALASLHLRYEALWLSQPRCELDLGYASSLPHRGDEGDELLMPLREDR